MKIILGKRYKIVGSKGGCGGSKCKDCYKYGILVDNIKPYNNNNKKGRTIHGFSLNKNGKPDKLSDCNLRMNHCSVHPDDLVPFKPTSLKEFLEEER